MFIVIGVVNFELVKEIPGQVFAEVLWQLGQPHGEGGQGTGDTPCGIRIIKIFCERGTGGDTLWKFMCKVYHFFERWKRHPV